MKSKKIKWFLELLLFLWIRNRDARSKFRKSGIFNWESGFYQDIFFSKTGRKSGVFFWSSGNIYQFVKPMFFLPLTSRMTHIRTPWSWKPRIWLSFNNHWSLLWVFKTDVLLIPNANRQTDKRIFFIWPSLQSREYIVLICFFIFIDWK